MSTPRVQIHVDKRVASLVIDRPPLNILDLATIAELDAAIDGLGTAGDLHAVVVRGAGERAFSAGVAIEDHVPEKIEAMLAGFHGALRKLWRLEAVTVAAVAGHCLGGGMELAAVCDLVIATDDSRFGQPEIELGCFPPLAAALYPELLGAGRATDLLLTGRILDCAEAERIGFVARRLPAGGLAPGIAAFLAELTEKSAAVLRLTKKALRAGRGERFERALSESERVYLDQLAQTHDCAEGIRAFLEKRPPVWQHR